MSESGSVRAGADAEGSGSGDGAVAAAVAGELRLLEPAVRRSAEASGALLDPEFTEVGYSGRRWDRAAILAALPTLEGSAEEQRIAAYDMAGTLLAPGLVHLTYRTESLGRRAYRSSLWRHHPARGWRLYHHQATPLPVGS